MSKARRPEDPASGEDRVAPEEATPTGAAAQHPQAAETAPGPPAPTAEDPDRDPDPWGDEESLDGGSRRAEAGARDDDWSFGLEPRAGEAASVEARAPARAELSGLARLRRRATGGGREAGRLGPGMRPRRGFAQAARILAVGARGALAVGAVFALVLTALGLPRAVDAARQWRDQARIETRPPAAGPLFRGLVEAGLIRLGAGAFALELAPEDLALRRKLPGAASDRWPERLSEDAETLLAFAHGEGAGRAVRAELAAWNAGLDLAAIRDAEDASWRAETILIPSEQGGSEADLDAPGFPARTGGAPPADRYGFFGWSAPDAPAPEGRWTRAAPASLTGLARADGAEIARLRFSRRIGPGALDDPSRIIVEDQPVTVDVLGRFPRVAGAEILERRRLCDRRAVVVEAEAAASRDLVEGAARAIAYRREIAPDCGPPDLQGPAEGHRLRLLPTGGSMVVTVEPAPSAPERLRPFADAPLIAAPPPDVARDPAAAGWVPYRGSEALTLWCGIRGAGAEPSGPRAIAADIGPACAAIWAAPPAKPVLGAGSADPPDLGGSDADAPETPPALQLETDDGVPLLSAEARPTREAAALGLAPLIGVGPEDRFGLIRTLPAGVPARLTLRARWQRAAARAIARLETDPELRALAPRRFDDRRRVALVALDAGDDPRRRGAVLAAALDQPGAAASAQRLADAASGPRAEGAAWNALGLDLWRPRQSPLAPRAWSRADARATPGSTLKTLTALALIRRAALREFDPGARAPLKGPLHRAIEGAPSAEAAPGLPLPTDARIDPGGWVEIPGRYWAPAVHDCVAGRAGPFGWRDAAKICNFVFQGRLEAHDYALLAPSETGCPVRFGGDAETTQLGLCEATATSLNSWFVATALGLSTGDAAQPPRLDGAVAATGRRALETLADRLPAEDARNLARRDAPAAARFRAEPIRFEAQSDNPLFQLGLLAIGQNAQAPPLAIAALYGGIASGCRLDPFALARPDGRAAREAGCRPLLFDPSLDADLSRDPAGRDAARRRETYALELIRKHLTPGLRAVVSSRRGTADAAFEGAIFAPWLRGKTGTAEIPLPDAEGGGLINTAWFAGWLERPAIDAPEEAGWLPAALDPPERVAFACMATDVTGSGGRVCAPLVRAFFEELAAEGAER
ncbi:MAG: hypothetical protein AAFW46_01460 [Pseudomonadota bacterium]